MTTLKTITGEVLRISANHSAQTFTIRTGYGKFRTYRLRKDEFSSCLNNTGNDWKNFLKSDDYYKV